MEKQYLTVYTPTRQRAPSITSLFHRSASAPNNLNTQNESQPPSRRNSFFQLPIFALVGGGGGGGGSSTNLFPDPLQDESFQSDKFNTEVPFKEYCVKRCLRFFPISKWLPKYTGRKLIHDFLAGLLVGLSLIPQALALALLAGLPPRYGLYSGFMGCFVYVFFGSTNYVTIGPTAVMCIMTYTYGHDKPEEYVILLTFLTGITTLALGFMQLGFIVNFVSIPVSSGFTSAAALTICYTQAKPLLGIKFTGVGFLQIAEGSIKHIKEVGMWDITVAGGCLVALLILRKLECLFSCVVKRGKPWSKIIWLISVSRGIIVTLACTIVFAVIGSETIVGILGEIQAGIPSPTPPPFRYEVNTTRYHDQDDDETFMKVHTIFDLIRQDTTVLLVFPFLALMEHSLNAKQFSGAKSIDFSQELIAIGLSNIASSFFGSMPITGAFPRTGVNQASGVETPMGGIVTGVLVLISLQFCTPWFYYMPKAAIAAMNIISAVFTIDFMLPRRLWKCKRMDLIPYGITFLVSLFAGLQYGLLVGFLISVVFLLYWAASPKIRVNRCKLSTTGSRFILVDLDRSLTFPSAEYTRTVVMKSGERWAHGSLPVVIDCFHMHFADYTAAQGIVDLFKVFNSKAQPLILFRLKPSVERIVTSLLVMDEVAFFSAQTQLQLQEVLESLVVLTKNVGSNVNEDCEKPGQVENPVGEVLDMGNTSEYDLITDSASPSLIYPDSTRRQHIGKVDFTVGDKPISEQAGNDVQVQRFTVQKGGGDNNDENGPDSPVDIVVSEH